MTTTRVLVVGGTRFIGAFVVRELAARGHEVTVVHRGETEADLPDGVEHLHHPGPFVGSRPCFAELEGEFRARRPHVVLDMICGSAGDGHALSTTFRGIADRAVVVSSIDVYRAYGVLLGREPAVPEPTPLAEDAPLRRTLYPYRSEKSWPEEDGRPWHDDYDKIVAERMAAACPDLPVTVVRLPMVHGPGAYRYYEYVRRMQDGRPALLLDERACSWLATRAYVENAALAIAGLVEDDGTAGSVFNVGDPVPTTELDWVRRIAAELRWDGRIVAAPADRLPPDLAEDAIWEQPLVADDRAIRQMIGFAERVDADEGLARTVAWQLATPPDGFDGFDYAAEDETLAALEDEPALEGTVS